jgi:hypothetical protein
VYVCAHPGNIAGDPEHQVGALRPDPRKGGQDVGVAGDFTAVVFDHLISDRANLLRLAFMKRAIMDQLVDLLRSKLRHCLGRPGQLEQVPRHQQGHLIHCADRDHAGDQLFEGRVVALLSQFEQSCFWERLHRLPHPVHDDIDIKG